ncbi:peptide chain release factor N(5)-glutamine methyltransferase [Helcococcus ovis]|uniref:Release factor glutamine methyltransferase n=2 Tax=Peptoniphilaceae TaxID=1570339 RepID=A0A4R9C4S5_9FIRM|nr:peptide chain release factor N(5)-glutamine methyltransferase [Helcococcus ovis]TFF66731.1 peptide chain release factor N(5)-glutamine methyltransferase [Helcococcus ovis]TFF67423.1 peptide chain release factor N(5)-glutamine methyltransferase [Helcococcus ovis]
MFYDIINCHRICISGVYMKDVTINDLLNGNYRFTKTVLQYILDYTLADIFQNRFNIISEEKYLEFMKIQEKLNDKIPLQYAIGKWNFYSRDFIVDENVLIPRPETELLVDEVLKENLEGKSILDIGTGSGAIAISIDLESSNCNVYASDISVDALDVAKKNAAKFNSNVKFIESDLFQNIDGKFDIIVSNPPYLSEEEYDKVDEIIYYEPKNAFVGGEKGFEIYEKIIKDASKYLNENGKIFFEIGYMQAEIVRDLLLNHGYNNIKIKKDYGNLDRIVIGELCLKN